MECNIFSENVDFIKEFKNSGSTAQEVLDVSIRVILRGLDKYKFLSGCNAQRKKLAQYCHRVLLNKTIRSNCVIRLEDSKLARVYGISCIIVKTFKTVENSCTNMYSGLVTMNTSVIVESWQSEEFYSLTNKVASAAFGGYDHELKQLFSLLCYNKLALDSSHKPVGVLLHGPSGCGKSLIGKQLAHMYDAVFINVEKTDLLGSDYGAGSSALRQKFKKAQDLSLEGTVIFFIDELEILCPRNENASLGSRQITNALASEMDRLHKNSVCNLLILAASNSVASVHPSLRRPGRFDREVCMLYQVSIYEVKASGKVVLNVRGQGVLINVPTKGQRVAILQALTSDMHLDQDVSLEEVAVWTVGYVGADLQMLIEEAANHAHSENAVDQNIGHTVKMSHFKQALHTVSPSLKKSSDSMVEFQPVKWTEIGGLEEVKAEIQQSIEWPLLHLDALQWMDLSPTKGILLFGPPGCCKTTLVRAAATACHVTFLSLNGAQVYSPYVGESERIISEAFQKARALSPSILFLDEIESLVSKRSCGSRQSRVQERILSTMLNEMDGIGTRLDSKLDAVHTTIGENNQQMIVNTSSQQNSEEVIKTKEVDNSQIIVIGATNRLDMLDPAILRPGRLDKKISVPAPDMESREAILKIKTSRMSLRHVNLKELSELTKHFSGADLNNLCKEAGLLALRENMKDLKNDSFHLLVQHSHFLKALETVKPSLISA